MNPAVRVGLYVGGLVVVLGASFYLVPLVRDHRPFTGPPRHSAPPNQAGPAGPSVRPLPGVALPEPDGDADAGAASVPTVAATPAALSSAAAGYRLTSDTTSFPAGIAQPFRFQLLGPDGQPLRVSPRDADDLHVSLVVVRRDGAGFGHFEPVQDMSGTWSAPLTLPGGGSYAAWVSFTPHSGQEVVLGADLTVAGEFSPQTPPTPAPSADIDGYHVELAGTLSLGTDDELTATVSQAGSVVTDLQINDGAFAHLVMIRAGDLAFADAAAELVPGRPGALRFSVHPTASGTYWMYVVFRHHDQTHTVALTLVVPDPASPPPTPTPGAVPIPSAAAANAPTGRR